jgi:hypothetical protein
MTVSLYHLQLNVSDRARSLPFYREFFGYFGYRTIAAGPDFFSWGAATGPPSPLWRLGSVPAQP